MKVSVIVLIVVSAVLMMIAGRQSETQLRTGLLAAWQQLAAALPLVILTFVVLGLLNVIVPREFYVRWLSQEAGWRALVVGAAAGAIAPGGPVVQTVIAATLLKSGAGIGCVVSFLTAGALSHLMLLPLEVGLLGWRFVVLRLACTVFFAPVAGALAHHASRMFGR